MPPHVVPPTLVAHTLLPLFLHTLSIPFGSSAAAHSFFGHFGFFHSLFPLADSSLEVLPLAALGVASSRTASVVLPVELVRALFVCLALLPDLVLLSFLWFRRVFCCLRVSRFSASVSITICVLLPSLGLTGRAPPSQSSQVR